MKNSIISRIRNHLVKRQLLRKGWVPSSVPMAFSKGTDAGTVLHVLFSSLPYILNGYGVRSHSILRSQKKLGLPIVAVSRPGFPWDLRQFQHLGIQDVPHTEWLDGVEYRRIADPEGGWGKVPLDVYLNRYVEHLCRVVEEVQPAVLHAASNFVNGCVAGAVGRACRIPVIYEARGFWEMTRGSVEPAFKHSLLFRCHQRLETQALEIADAVVCISEGLKNEIRRRGVVAEKIHVIPNGVECQKFTPRAKDPVLRSALGLEGKVVIGYLGSLVEYEGIDVLLQACAHLVRRHVPLKVLIVGDGVVRKKLEDLATDLALGEAVCFTGRVPHAEVLRYYSVIDICPFPRKNLEICHIVTPLKPYEAMAMEKAVIVSDVGALQEMVIEGQTGLVCQASSAESLADTIGLLVADRVLRERLGKEGRSWVLVHRDWETLAQRYLPVYETFGVTGQAKVGEATLTGEKSRASVEVRGEKSAPCTQKGQSAASQDGLARSLNGVTERTAEIAAIFDAHHPVGGKIIQIAQEEGFVAAIEAFRVHRRSRAPLPYYLISSVDQKIEEAQAIICEGWSIDGLPRFSLAPPLAWDSDPYTNRMWQSSLNAWEPLGPILKAHEAKQDRQFLVFAAAVALDWLYQHEESGEASKNPFAWYDRAVGLRAARLAYLLDAISRDQGFSFEEVWMLLRGAARHAISLRDPDSFAGHSNHGFYQAVGLLILTKAFPELAHFSTDMALAEERVRGFVPTSWSPEGVYLEHSPGYHLMVTETLEWLIDAGLMVDADTFSLYARAQDALAWFIHPQGFLARFGDTDLQQMAGTEDRPFSAKRPGRSPALLYVQSEGKEGTPPETTYRVFPQAGYAVFRSGWPQDPQAFRRASYLAFAAAFHSRVHKQADDFTFEWSEKEHAIIVDAGKYGYHGRTKPGSALWEAGFWYADPARVYVESTRAHNTVVIDGLDDPRRGVKPYGSALGRWGEHSELYFVEASLCRLSTVQHRRTLVLSPGQWLIVLDWLWDKRVPHEYTQWFHFGPDLEVQTLGSGFEASLPEDKERLFVLPLLESAEVTLRAVKGQTEPCLQGWTSFSPRELTPNWAASFSQQGDRVVFATLLAFAEARPKVEERSNSIDMMGNHVRLAWHINGQRRGFILEHLNDKIQLHRFD